MLVEGDGRSSVVRKPQLRWCSNGWECIEFGSPLLSSPPLPAGLVDRVPTGGVTGLTATGGAPTSLQAPTPPHAHRLTLPVIHGGLLTTCHLHLAPPWHAASICFSWRLRDVLLRKNCCSFGFFLNYVPPPKQKENVPNIRHFHMKEQCISKGLSKRNL